jgi:hypothetical protein
VAHQVAAQGADAGHGHEVAEGEHGAERRGREHVTQRHEAVAFALEAAPPAEVDGHELGRFGDPGPHHGLGPHRHRPVGEDDGGVHGEPGREHAHAHQVPVPQREGEQQHQRPAQEPPVAATPDHRDGHLQRHPCRSQGRQLHHRVAQVGAERPAQDAEQGARHDGDEQGGHDDRRYPGRRRRPGRGATAPRGAVRGRRRRRRRR